jgi:hypothetical protein
MPDAVFFIQPCLGAVMDMTSVGTTSVLTNVGTVVVNGDGNVNIDAPYVPFVGFPGPLGLPAPAAGLLKRIQGKLTLGGKLVGHVGVIDNGAGDGIVFAAGIDMTDGEIDSNGKMDVVGGFQIAGGTVLIQGDMGNLPLLTADNLTQTGGTLNVLAYTTVTDTYDFAGGTADFNLTGPHGIASFGTLVAEAGGLSLSGHINATNGFNVAGGGDVIVYNGAEDTQVTADILVAGTLRLYVSHLFGNLINEGLVVLGDDGDPGSGVQLTGDYTQSGTLEVHLGDSAINAMDVSGHVQLGGVLHVIPAPLAGGWMLPVIRYGSRTGELSLAGPSWLEMWYDDPSYPNALGVKVNAEG